MGTEFQLDYIFIKNIVLKLPSSPKYTSSYLLYRNLHRNANKIIMNTSKKAHLQRIESDRPRHYYHDIHTGKHYLLDENGSKIHITKIGTKNPKFREYKSGFINHKGRYEESKIDQNALHFIPKTTYKSQNSLYTPQTKKFAGYAQLPYKLKGRQTPVYLSSPMTPDKRQETEIRKSSSMHEGNHQMKKENHKHENKLSLILQKSTAFFQQKKVSDQYFQLSFNSITESKPILKHRKKTCYNYKCKHKKQFTFDEKSLVESKMVSTISTNRHNLIGKSFFEKQLLLEAKQL